MNQKNLIRIIVGVLLLLIVVVVGWFVSNKSKLVPQPEPRVAMLDGWLFEIEMANGVVQRYMILDNGELVEYLTEQDILKRVRSDKWIEPTLKWTPQEWQLKCDEKRKLVRACSQSEFDDFMKSLCQDDPKDKFCGVSFENWRLVCENRNQELKFCILTPSERYKTLMEDYLREHQINGSIKSALVVGIPVVGSNVWPEQSR